MTSVPVRIESSRPIFIEVDAQSFGDIFGRANAGEQAAILDAMMRALRQFPLQIDYVTIELIQPQFAETLASLRQMVSEIPE